MKRNRDDSRVISLAKVKATMRDESDESDAEASAKAESRHDEDEGDESPVIVRAEIIDLAIQAESKRTGFDSFYVASIIESGRDFQAIFDKTEYGEWAALFPENHAVKNKPWTFSCSQRTADRYRAIVAHPTLSDPKHSAQLPPHVGTLAKLARIPAPKLESLIAESKLESNIAAKTISPQMSRADAESLIDKRSYDFSATTESVLLHIDLQNEWQTPPRDMILHLVATIRRKDANPEHLESLLEWFPALIQPAIDLLREHEKNGLQRSIAEADSYRADMAEDESEIKADIQDSEDDKNDFTAKGKADSKALKAKRKAESKDG